MKRFLIILALLALLVSVSSAAVLEPKMWYNGSSPTNGETLNETCHLWAIENAEDPDRWFRRSEDYTNFYRQYYGNDPTTYIDYANDRTLNAEDIMEMPLDWTKAPNSSLGYSTVNWHLGCCKDYDYNCGVKVLTGWTWTSDYAEVIANFTGTPLEATAPAYVYFTDTSTNETGTCTYNWSFDPTDGVLVAPQDLDNEDITMLFTENGNFTISHGVSCGDAGSSISTKTDYIHIVNATELSTFRIRAVDALSGYGINGAEVDVFDIENSSWTNQTSVTGEVTVSALTGHTVDAYGSATGYDDGESLALPAVQGELYPIYMMPSSFVTNVSEGNITLYLTVFEDGTNTRLSGMSVSLSKGAGGADFTMGVTNENGVFQTVVNNQTNYLATVMKQKGYLGGSKSFYSGNQSGGDAHIEVEIWLQKNYITTAPTATTLPGGGTPTATLTYLPNCDPSASDYDAAKCRTSKGSSGLNLLADNLENLILLCIVVTMFYLLGIRLGR